MPRVFRRFPIRASAFLPMNCVIDGQFDVQEERHRIAMNPEDQIKLGAALGLIPAVASLGREEEWSGSQWLGQLSKLDTAFSETAQSEELEWWNDRLHELADELSKRPLVKTTQGNRPAQSSTDQPTAHFILQIGRASCRERV